MSSPRSLLRALATVSGMTLLSRILGFVRDFVIAHSFGASLATDAFVVAFRLPNLLRRLFAEGAFSQAFVPLLGEYRSRRGEAETKRLVDRTASALLLAVTLISVLGILGAPVLIYVSAPGFSADADKFALTVELTRITFPYILFMALVALSAGILNTWGRFAVPAFTPVMLNVAMIGGALLLAPRLERPIVALAWSVFLGGMLQLAIQLPALKRIGMLPRFELAPKDEGVRRILKLMGPAVLGVSVAQISFLINTIFASFLPSGSVSWLYYADRLMEFPAGLLGAALGTILLPSLTRSHAENDPAAFTALLDWGLRVTLLLTLPAALALGLLAVPLISTLFQHGVFRAEDVFQTRAPLVAYSVGLVGMILVKILAPGYYARQNIRTPVKIAVITLVATQAMNLAFIGWLRHAGLALSIGLASCLNAVLLMRGLRSSGTYVPAAGWGTFAAKIATALLVMGVVLWVLAGPDDAWTTATSAARVTKLAIVVAAGAFTYLGTLFALGFRPRDFHHHG